MEINSADRTLTDHTTYVFDNGHTCTVEHKTIFTEKYGEFETFHISCTNAGINIILTNGTCASNINKDIVVMQDLLNILRKVDPTGASCCGQLSNDIDNIKKFNNDRVGIRPGSQEVLKDFLTHMFKHMKIDKKSPLFWAKERLINNNLY